MKDLNRTRHDITSQEWRNYHTKGTIQYKFRKIVWLYDKWYDNRQWKRGIIKGTLLTKNGIEILNKWITLIPPYGEFTINDGMKTVSDQQKVGGYQNCLKVIEFALIKEGLAIEKGTLGVNYEFTERGRKLIRHGSLKKLISQELNEDRAKSAKYRRDIYWLLFAALAFLASKFSDILVQWLAAMLKVYCLKHQI